MPDDRCSMHHIKDDATKGNWNNNTADMVSNSGNFFIINKATFKNTQEITNDSSTVSCW